MAIYQLDQLKPQIDPTAFIFDSADIIGDVVIEAGASVWANVSIRGDNARIHIGRGSNIQESSVLHVDPDAPLIVEDNVTIGHQAMLHGCLIGAGSLVAMQAIVLNHAKIGKNCREPDFFPLLRKNVPIPVIAYPIGNSAAGNFANAYRHTHIEIVNPISVV